MATESHRIVQLRSQMAERSLDAMLVTHLPHIRYMAGFSGSAGMLVVTSDKALFITDFRYQEQIRKELRSNVTGVVDRAPYDYLKREGIIAPTMRVGFQEGYLTVSSFENLKKKFRGTKFEPTGSLVSELVTVKTAEEIRHVKKAADIAAKVYAEVLKIVRPGMRETEVAMEISYLGKKFGSEGDAFDIIVASGPRGALPHGRASSRKIKNHELVTLDFGCIHNGFNSDMTRTFAVGTPSAEAQKIYDIVLRSEQMGVRAARPGMTGKELDDVCRDEIVAAGYGEAFGHSTGHGLGIEVHEGPAVSFRGENQVLREGMIVTIEPGIYLPGRCGVRIEDDVAITASGRKVLTSSPRELIVL